MKTQSKFSNQALAFKAAYDPPNLISGTLFNN